METLCLLSYRGNAEKLTSTPTAEANPEPEKHLTGILAETSEWWQVRDSNPRSTKRLIYSQIHLAALVTCRAPLSRCRERIALK